MQRNPRPPRAAARAAWCAWAAASLSSPSHRRAQTGCCAPPQRASGARGDGAAAAPVGREVSVRVAAGAHVRRQRASHAHHAGEKRGDRVVLQQHAARRQLRQDAAQRPDVDAVVVRQAQDNLRRAVAARLDVGGQVVGDVAAAAHVDHLDAAARVGLNQDVLRLQVAVQQTQRVHKRQRAQHLARDGLQAAVRKVRRLLALPVVLLELVQVRLRGALSGAPCATLQTLVAREREARCDTAPVSLTRSSSVTMKRCSLW